MNLNDKWFRFFLGLLLFHLLSNVFWIILNKAPAPWDPASHAHVALKIKESIERFSVPGILNASNYYPIFIHTLSALPIFVFNLFYKNPVTIIKSIQTLGTIYFLLTLVSVYLYTKLVLKNSREAFIATVIFSLFPIMYAQSRWLMLDIPLCGLFMIDLYFLEKSANFTDKKNSLLFFLFAGFLILTKWTGLIFLLFPIIPVLIRLLKQKNLLKSFINISLGLTLLFALILPWYLTNLAPLMAQAKINIIGESSDPINLFSMQNLILYLNFFVNVQVTPILALIFFICSFYLILARNKQAFYFLALIALNYITFTLIGNKDPRYTMPILPFVAIIIALGLNKIRRISRWTKYVWLVLIVVYFIYALILTIRPKIIENYRLFFYAPVIKWINVVDISDVLVEKYDVNTWKMDEIIHDLSQIDKNGPSKVLVVAEYEHFNPSTLLTYALAGKLKNTLITTPDIYTLTANYNQNYFPSNEAIEKYLNMYDYVFIAISQTGPDYLRNKLALEQIRSYFIGNYFKPCAEYINVVAEVGSKCVIRNGEKLSAKSDILTENNAPITNKELLLGPDVIYCKYGCSFQKISYEAKVQNLNYKLIKSYTLPNERLVNLYKLN